METKLAKVQFQQETWGSATSTKKFQGKKYNYILEIDAKEGDVVVVDTQYGIALAKICEISEMETGVATKEIIQVVDLSEFEAKKEKAEKKAKLQKLMDVEMKKVEKILQYELLASKSEDFAKLLAEFKSL